MELVWPSIELLPRYVDALERGWSPVTHQGDAAARQELERIARDPEQFVALQVDREAKGPLIMRPDGGMVPRLPGYRRWIWEGEFCGTISLRWQPGTSTLPSHCPGHIGYSVVPWKRRRGYATRALAALLPDAHSEGLTYVELTTDVSNAASRRVIEANGGVLVERFQPAPPGRPPHLLPPREPLPEQLRYRIYLAGSGLHPYSTSASVVRQREIGAPPASLPRDSP